MFIVNNVFIVDRGVFTMNTLTAAEKDGAARTKRGRGSAIKNRSPNKNAPCPQIGDKVYLSHADYLEESTADLLGKISGCRNALKSLVPNGQSRALVDADGY